ncbi:hypothetical protein [Lysobacter sp.]|uniref:hypothetical protein n=1 Tax=Lysobacter sp. TaxID=72226 RepID=UPI002D6E416F|nr:hypothetical protein [Lysobacter sp.]HZX76164.1 hypothetical protein [Lysobacter sp.]
MTDALRDEAQARMMAQTPLGRAQLEESRNYLQQVRDIEAANVKTIDEALAILRGVLGGCH